MSAARGQKRKHNGSGSGKTSLGRFILGEENMPDRLKQPLITVVIPNYNGYRFLAQAIESVLAQTYPNLELIVVDDGSTDASAEIAAAKAQTDQRIRLIALGTNRGVANARNAGIAEAKGEYIALLDNDDLWTADKLERQLKIAQNGADIVYCSYDFIDENDDTIQKPFLVPAQTDYKKMLTSSVISSSTAFVKAELLQEHPFRSDFYHEDYVLWMELLRVCPLACGDRKVLMHYRQTSGSRSNNKIKSALERWKIYRYALGLPFLESICVFAKYAVNGEIKYRRI